MNLYRSFGNLMEAWVTDGGQCLDSVWLGNNDEEDPLTPSSDEGTNLRSQSVDSGVETASSVTSFPPTPCSVSTDNAEIDTFTAESSLASTSQSPVFSSPSSSSPHQHPSRPQGGSAALHLKLEKALQRTDSVRLKNNQETLTVDEVLRRRPRPSSVPKLELVRGQRSEGFGLGRTVNTSTPTRQMLEMCRRPMSLQVQSRSEDLGEETRKGLSPGLCYLEQVCQMLEEFARQQMHSRALQMEMDALREHRDMEASQAVDTCQGDSKAAEDDRSSCRTLGNTDRMERSSSVPQRRDFPYRHFRQRSASDTNIASLHLRKLNTDCRGQHLSIDDLLEKLEDDYEKQEAEKEEMNKSNKNWKLKFASFPRRSAVRDSKGQQTQSSEKNSARRRLSQLFRRRRKTLPE